MSWAEQLDSFLSATENSMARIKQRLCPSGTKTRGDLSGDPLPSWPPRPHSDVSCCQGVRDEVAALKGQLQAQAQVMASLSQAVRELIQEKEQQRLRICGLEEQLGWLQGVLARAVSLERRVEGLSGQLQGLRDQVRGGPADVPPAEARRPAAHLGQDRILSSALLAPSPRTTEVPSGRTLYETGRWEPQSRLRRDQPTRRPGAVLSRCSESPEARQEWSQKGLDRTGELARTEMQDARRDLDHIRCVLTTLQTQLQDLPREPGAAGKGPGPNSLARSWSGLSSSASKSSCSSSGSDRSGGFGATGCGLSPQNWLFGRPPFPGSWSSPEPDQARTPELSTEGEEDPDPDKARTLRPGTDDGEDPELLFIDLG
ncbi:uncharacterized protein LOC119940252 [Tachyglossus aculeatus]|uniref:uncharacterized protein LOC119940252 n=1 Tax=Tachyglossus aculeatus TaxID=9261 RepID=UPI0018F5AA88|nr:uncharacterized protein LOC119940252 [Tachyglossus aculeatus]